ncbi:MAG TPA: alpha/beta hydrolase [Solimonas sp.]|nr:alpha/beta hydrolase [Solimonas sp.]
MELFKLKILRWLAPLMVRFKWRGRVPPGVVAEPLQIVSGETSVPARCYRPEGAAGPLPVILYFHGGGWVGLDLDTHDPLCRDLCRHSGHMVISVDYRIAPEHPFPAGVQDCLGALDWLVQNAAGLGGDVSRLSVAGDSAGGNLAAVVALEARRRHPGVLKGQILIYPATDHPAHADWPSYRSHGGKEYPLTLEGMKDLWRLYTTNSSLWPTGAGSHDLATPYRVQDLGGLPPALLLIAEEDLLRDEGIAYGQRMQEAGVSVQVKTYPGQKHGFIGMEPTEAHLQAMADVKAWTQGLHA